jgi:cytochrome c5
MSDSSHSNESEGLIKTPTQLIVVVVLAFVVPIAAIFAIIHFVVGGDKPRPASSTVYDKAVLERIRPVGSTPDIEKGPSPLAPAPAAAAAAAPADGKAAGPDGKAIYDASCKVCHDAGVANAPKKGVKAAWGPRGNVATLVASAIKGKGGMPPKGGNASLSEADLKAAIEYMIK